LLACIFGISGLRVDKTMRTEAAYFWGSAAVLQEE